MNLWPRDPIGRAVFVAIAIVVFLFVGSLLYWLADGGGGNPENIRQRVADAELDVEWSNNGSSGGIGSVDASCGPVVVTIDEVDDELWIRWADNREVLTPESIDALLPCSR